MMNLSQLSQSTSLNLTNTQAASSSIPFTNVLEPQESQSSPNSGSGDLHPSSDNQSTSAADKSITSVSRAVIEDIAEVNPKTLAKALRPPVTIKNFFKPTSQPSNSRLTSKPVNSDTGTCVSDPKKDQSSKHTEIENVKENNETAEKDNNSSSKNMKKEMSYSEFLEFHNGDDKVMEKSDSAKNDSATIQSENIKSVEQDMEPETDIVILDEVSNDGSSDSGTTASGVEDSSSVKPNLTKKRKREDKSCSQPAKKSKQVTLKSSFAKMESKSVTCPICNKVFEKGISNADLNQHIDNCIIE